MPARAEESEDCNLNPCFPKPGILGTLFNEHYAGGNITWCGETWTPAEIVAGAQKTICPTDYDIGKNTYTTTTPNVRKRRQQAGNLWKHGNDLILRRSYDRTWSTAFYPIDCWLIAAKELQVGTTIDKGSSGGSQWGLPPGCSVTSTRFTNRDIGLISGVAYPTSNNYLIPDGFFGSYMGDDAILYTWARGIGW